MEAYLEQISQLLQQATWLAPFLAFLSGVLVSFTPCSLSTVPLIIGYVGGRQEENTKRSFKISLVFALGMALTFTIFGVAASLFGKMMSAAGSWWYILLGILMVLMALQTWELVTFIKPTYLTSKNKKKGYGGAFLVGILGGLFSSPCSTPILVVLLAIVGAGANLLWGMLLLLCYALGNSILTVIAGTFIGFTKSLNKSKKYGKINNVIKYVLGFVMLLFAFYMFYLGF